MDHAPGSSWQQQQIVSKSQSTAAAAMGPCHQPTVDSGLYLLHTSWCDYRGSGVAKIDPNDLDVVTVGGY